MHRIDDLLYLMARLRDPQTGCQWDLAQTHQSLAPYCLEEAFELVEAIEQGDLAALPGELGDLLFQVVYHSQLAAERGQFAFAEVVDTLARKLLRRHPHVFPDGTVHGASGSERPDAKEVIRRWEHIKAEERKAAQSQTPTSLLDDLPAALPALARAQRLQKRVARVGFDWQDSAAVLDKIDEELAELRAAIHEGDSAQQGEELGDVLFTLVNLARHLQQDAETALRKANRKFERRFRFTEQRLQQAGETLENTQTDKLEALWQQAKQQEQQEKAQGDTE